MNGPWQDRTALVTGGSRGIGRAIALALARQGAAVAVNYRERADAAAEVVALVARNGGRAMAVQADVRDFAAVKAMTDTVARTLGPIDILVNNAGILRDKPVAFMTDEEWNAVLDTCLKGAFHCIKALSKSMARAKRGRIVNIASDAGLLGDMMRANYASAKAGMIGLTKTVAREMAASGVTVNALAPGVIETELLAGMTDSRRRAMLDRVPMGRFGTPDEVAAAVIALVSDTGAYITGEVLRVDGGLAMR